jgi:hypothetical protein
MTQCMPTVSTPLSGEAQTIFTRLGYSVSGDGSEFIAERKWRSVHVTALRSGATLSDKRARTDGGTVSSQCQLRCFVAPKSETPFIKKRLTAMDPEYEWAIIGLNSDENGQRDINEYDVILPNAR